MKRIILMATVALVMAAMMALGAGTATAEPFGPNPYPKGCVGSAAAPAAIENNGLSYLVIDPPQTTPGYFWRDLSTVECREERG